MEGIKMIPALVLMIAIAGIIVGATVITTAKFGDTTDKCYNSSYEYNSTTQTCHNMTSGVAFLGTVGPSGTNLSQQMFAILKSSEAQGDIAEQLPTVAIIAIMVVIISIIAGVFTYVKYFG